MLNALLDLLAMLHLGMMGMIHLDMMYPFQGTTSSFWVPGYHCCWAGSAFSVLHLHVIHGHDAAADHEQNIQMVQAVYSPAYMPELLNAMAALCPGLPFTARSSESMKCRVHVHACICLPLQTQPSPDTHGPSDG